MSLLESLVYFVDHVCTSPYVVHMAFGVFFGFLIGFLRPKLAFWAAFAIGFSKETIDYFKHAAESETFSYLTDPKYGLYDGMEDWLFWMIGGYIAYRLLQWGHHKSFHKGQAYREKLTPEKIVAMGHVSDMATTSLNKKSVKKVKSIKVQEGGSQPHLSLVRSIDNQNP